MTPQPKRKKKARQSKTMIVDITPAGLAYAMVHAKTLEERLVSRWALRELRSLIAVTPEHKKPSHWKGW